MMILAVIQARMSSSRLPGKVLLPILGKPVIWHIYNRLKFSKKLNEICISTSTDSLDDPIVQFAKENEIKYFRGSSKNLVSRHLGAANFFNADVVVRITSDDPLVDPKVVDKLITIYENNPDSDFVSNSKEHTFPVGLEVEVMPKQTLEKLLSISNDPIFHEFFISNYIYEHPNEFKSIGYKLKKSNLLRWTLDYPEDYEFIKKIYGHLYSTKEVFHMKDIISLLREKPDLKKINLMHYSEFSHLKYEKRKIKKN